jgi:hypothetical protein
MCANLIVLDLSLFDKQINVQYNYSSGQAVQVFGKATVAPGQGAVVRRVRKH